MATTLQPIAFRDYIDGADNRPWLEGTTEYRTLAGCSNNKNYVCVFKFELPKGAKKVTFSACVDTGGATISGVELRYKLVTGAEDPSLANANANTAADGIYITDTLYNFNRFSFTIDKSVPSGMQYLYIWSNKSTDINNVLEIIYQTNTEASYHTYITYEEGGAVIYIDNGSSFDAYEIWIDNGTSWDQYAAHIDNGSSWDECG